MTTAQQPSTRSSFGVHAQRKSPREANNTETKDVVTVRLWQEASLWLPTGRVVAVEPFLPENRDAFAQTVAPGVYPVVLAVAEFGEPGEQSGLDTVAAAKLVIRDEPVVSWEMAVSEEQDLAELESDDSYFGYPVDGATGSFLDAAFAENYTEDFVDQLLDLLIASRMEGRYAATYTDGEGRPVVVAFPTGDGDGSYPTWVGRTAGGEVACFVTDFFVLTYPEDVSADFAQDQDPSPVTS
ncbi:DUF4241 domain-containing protein [Amycolatopsis sp. NPDC004368]